MDISGSHRIPAPRSSVWAGLKDPAVLRECVPGCESVGKLSDREFEGVVAAKIGPLKTMFSGRATVDSSAAPERFAISVNGSDATAGSGEGRAEVTLTEEDGATVVAYSGSAEVEGKIAQLGSRLVSGVARQTVESFFARLAVMAEEGRLPGSASADAAASDLEPEPPLADAPPLAAEEPASAPTEIADAPPLVSGGAPLPESPAPIAPTATPDVPDPAALAAAQGADGRAMSRIMLVAAIVVAAGVALYFLALQPPA